MQIYCMSLPIVSIMLCVNSFHIVEEGDECVFNTLIHYITENIFLVYVIYIYYYINYVSNRAIIYYIIYG